MVNKRFIRSIVLSAATIGAVGGHGTVGYLATRSTPVEIKRLESVEGKLSEMKQEYGNLLEEKSPENIVSAYRELNEERNQLRSKPGVQEKVRSEDNFKTLGSLAFILAGLSSWILASYFVAKWRKEEDDEECTESSALPVRSRSIKSYQSYSPGYKIYCQKVSSLENRINSRVY